MTTLTERLRTTRIVDADSHINEPADIWTSRLPKKFLDIAPRVERAPDTQHSHWRIGDHWLWPVGHNAQAGWNEYPPSTPWEYEDCDPATYEARDRLTRLDEYGLASQVLYPNIVGFYAGHMLAQGPEFAELCVKAYNDFSLEWASADSKRLIPIAMLPFWDLDASRREIRRCADMGFKGLLFANKMERAGLPTHTDSHWDPIYNDAQELGLAINFHIGFADSWIEGDLSADSVAQRRKAAESWRPQSVLKSSSNAMMQTDLIGSLLLSGLCERFPRLKFVSVETGFGQMPFYLEALDWHWKSKGNTSLPLLPSEYFKRQCYCTFWFDRVSLPLLAAYPDNFMFSTDYPHPISLAPGPCSGTQLLPRDWIADAFADIDWDLTYKAISGNAAKVYGLDES